MLAAIVIPVLNEAAVDPRQDIANGTAIAAHRAQWQIPPESLPRILNSFRSGYATLPYANGHSEPEFFILAPTGASAVLPTVEEGA